MASFTLRVSTDDFVGPAQNCIKPVPVEQNTTLTPGTIELEMDGTAVEVSSTGERQKLKAAKITLSDCLACSGCITTAESILVNAQSKEEFLSVINAKQRTLVVSISPQSRASLAAHFGISIRQAAAALTTFFKSLGARYVFDTSFSRDISLLEMRQEFVAKYRAEATRTADQPHTLPLVASACPGVVCYAEKGAEKTGAMLPHISTVRSPQQIMGVLVKNYLARGDNLAPESIYHVTVMPCYDKKLEAARSDFASADGSLHDVDCVLTTGEVLELIEAQGLSLATLPESPLDPLFSNLAEDGTLYGVRGGSGGYLEAVFRYAAKELFGVEIAGELEYKQKARGRGNPDFKEVTLEVEGKTVLTFAFAYGFRNIQNIVRDMAGKNTYHFVEVMACPSGCINGGGQLKPTTGELPREHLARVDSLYHNVTFRSAEANPAMQHLYETWIGDGAYSDRARALLHTQYHSVPPTEGLMVKW